MTLKEEGKTWGRVVGDMKKNKIKLSRNKENWGVCTNLVNTS